jgi:hypothetical protein
MNPTAGSFNITPRMQRHFVTFAVQMPSADIVRLPLLSPSPPPSHTPCQAPTATALSPS